MRTLAAFGVTAWAVTACGNGAPEAKPDTAVIDVACPCKAGEFCKDGQCKPRVPEAEAAKSRKSCVFGKGTLAAESVGKEHPVGKDLPIDTFVLVMMENRSFDHYFGAGPKFGLAVAGHPQNASNPNDKGEAVPIYHEATGCIHDVAHSWTASHKQWNGGKNDGFWLTNHSPAADGARALGYFDGSDLTFYYGLAKAFGISDAHHCSLLGPTWVNRMYYVAGTSWGLIRNEVPTKAAMAGRQQDHILAQLTKAGVDWRIYAQPLTVFLLFGDWFGEGDNASRLRGIDEYYADAKAGKLPPVSFVEPDYASSGAARQDEHPPGTPWQGEQFVHSVVTALMASPQWPRAAYIQTYDEHGGFYDHVAPPEACEPDDFPPKLEAKDSPGKFDRLGFRVPFLVASPWSRPGYVSHTTTDNTSPIRLVQARFNLPALTRRDANAWPLYDFFEFSKPQMLVPPKLPEPKPMATEIAACKKKWP
jgi:phospholipase C